MCQRFGREGRIQVSQYNSPTDWFIKGPHMEKLDDVSVHGSVVFES